MEYPMNNINTHMKLILLIIQISKTVILQLLIGMVNNVLLVRVIHHTLTWMEKFVKTAVLGLDIMQKADNVKIVKENILTKDLLYKN